MTAIVIALVIVFAILAMFWRILRAIFRPIFVFVYELMVEGLMRLGMSRMAARATISAVFVLLILVLLF